MKNSIDRHTSIEEFIEVNFEQSNLKKNLYAAVDSPNDNIPVVIDPKRTNKANFP